MEAYLLWILVIAVVVVGSLVLWGVTVYFKSRRGYSPSQDVQAYRGVIEAVCGNKRYNIKGIEYSQKPHIISRLELENPYTNQVEETLENVDKRTFYIINQGLYGELWIDMSSFGKEFEELVKTLRYYIEENERLSAELSGEKYNAEANLDKETKRIAEVAKAKAPMMRKQQY